MKRPIMTIPGILQSLLKPIRAAPINTSTVALTSVPFLFGRTVIAPYSTYSKNKMFVTVRGTGWWHFANTNIAWACVICPKIIHTPSKFSNEFAHQQGPSHPTNSKDRHSEGVQDGEELLIRSPVVTFYQCLIVEVFDVLVEERLKLI